MQNDFPQTPPPRGWNDSKTSEIDFTVEIKDSRFPGLKIVNRGNHIFGVVYELQGFFKTKKRIILDSFRVGSESYRPSYEESVKTAGEFFDSYLNNKTLQRLYSARIGGFK